ncbi:hypothetical protein HGRIS_012373 [Hohenbuehelia grisea]|uniref:Cytochrome b-c1 complex subunit 8 n=1 Tax=Hohenbuehelia grisea TaxID=104357 RepID=A0ABR3IS39_9AGAR
MRSTAPRFGDMPGGKTYLNWWGNVTHKQRGVIQYAVSSNETSPMRHIFRNYLFNGYRRLSGQALYVVIPFACGMSSHVLSCYHSHSPVLCHDSIIRLRYLHVGQESL